MKRYAYFADEIPLIESVVRIAKRKEKITADDALVYLKGYTRVQVSQALRKATAKGGLERVSEGVYRVATN